MKLPWNKQYLTIAFHVIVTVVAIGAAMMIMAQLSQFAGVIQAGFFRLVHLFSPLLFAVVIAFLLNPLVGWMQRKVLRRPKPKEGFEKRTLATALSYLLFFAALILLGGMMVRSLGASSASQMALAVERYVNSIIVALLRVQEELSQMGILSNLNEVINTLVGLISAGLQNMVISVGTGVASVGSMALNLALGFLIAFYMLMEKDAFLHRLQSMNRVFLPRKVSKRVERFCTDLNTVFSGYVTGQLTDAMIMAAMIIVSFWVAGIPYAVVIVVISGFSNLIPYVGAIVAYILSILMGLLSGEPIKALYAAIIVLVLQQIDSMIIVPRVVGKSVELHPALVILALSVFGGLFGLVGMVFAVPVTALIKLYIDRAYERKKKRLLSASQEGTNG